MAQGRLRMMRVMDISIKKRINDKSTQRISKKILALFLIIFLSCIILLPFAEAESRGRQTLRSKFYEMFRCGNDSCDKGETERSCPADCAPKPAEENETASNASAQLANQQAEERKKFGLMEISTVIPTEEIYEPQQEPIPPIPVLSPDVSESQMHPVLESPSRIEKIETFDFSLAIMIILIVMLIGVAAVYSLRNKIPFFKKIHDKIFGDESGGSKESAMPEEFDFAGRNAENAGKKFEEEFEEEIPPPKNYAPIMPKQSIISRQKTGIISLMQKNRQLMIIKKDRFMQGVNSLLSKVRGNYKLGNSKQTNMKKVESIISAKNNAKHNAKNGGANKLKFLLKQKGKMIKDRINRKDKPESFESFNPSEQTILTQLIENFKHKGMPAKEIRHRLSRMGVWNDDIINEAIKNFMR